MRTQPNLGVTEITIIPRFGKDLSSHTSIFLSVQGKQRNDAEMEVYSRCQLLVHMATALERQYERDV
jgi:hypothetical protein